MPVKKAFLASWRTRSIPPPGTATQIFNLRRGSFAFGETPSAEKPANAKIARKRRKTGGSFCFLRQLHMQSVVTYVRARSLACKFVSLACRLSHHSDSLLTLSTSCVSPLAKPQNPRDSAPPVPPVSAEILRISGRGNCKKMDFVLEKGNSQRKNRPASPYTRRFRRLETLKGFQPAVGDDENAKWLSSSRTLLRLFDRLNRLHVLVGAVFAQ